MDGVVELPDWGVIHAVGDDAAKFLHGQLTQDFMLAKPDQARLCAYCSPKGRMLASFVGIKRNPADVFLLCRRDVLISALKRLSMFVLRAKVQLQDVSVAHRVVGLLGASAERAGAAQATWHFTAAQTGGTVTLPPGPQGLPRALWFGGLDEPLPAGPTLVPAQWQWAEVRSALGWVGPATSEAFVPQMLNYESLGGVNFKKGCYPGQEVVARSQFRGTLKRRAHLVHGVAPMHEGQDVYHDADLTQPCGTVVMAAAAPDGGHDALVSLQLSALAVGGLHLGAPDGAPLSVLSLPYPLLDDI